LRKSYLLLVPLFVGLALFVVSWWQTYPLYVTNVNGFIFDRVSILYWIALPIILVSLFAIANNFKSDAVKCSAVVCIVLFMYSFSYLYAFLPTSDSQAFRGLTEYFIKTGNLTPQLLIQSYLNYPSFFVLAKLAVSTTAMGLPSFEFILYTVIGFLLATSLYKYFSSRHRTGGFVAVVAFFIPMYYFLDYQDAPFTLAFALFLLALMVESRFSDTKERLILEVFLFIGMVFTHPFVPLFFILYELIIYVLNAESYHLRLFLLAAVIYFAFQVSEAFETFSLSIITLFHASSEYSTIVQASLTSASTPIDHIAQDISRYLVILTVFVAVTCFIYLIVKKKKGMLHRPVDVAILISGILYSFVGVFVALLGSRAIPIAFIPVCLGVAYVYESKFKKYVIAFFIISLLLFASLLIHNSFYTSQTLYQTQDAYAAENFLINEYNWAQNSLILAHTRVVTYLETKEPSSETTFESDFSADFPLNLTDYDTIMYTIGLGQNLQNNNLTLEAALQGPPINLVYDNGFSCITIKSFNLSSTNAP